MPPVDRMFRAEERKAFNMEYTRANEEMTVANTNTPLTSEPIAIIEPIVGARNSAILDEEEYTKFELIRSSPPVLSAFHVRTG